MSTVEVWVPPVKPLAICVAATVTQPPGSVGLNSDGEQDPNTAPFGGAAGDVKTTFAVPFEPVVTVRDDSVPKFVAVPLTSVSTRSCWPETGSPFGPRTLTTITDCDEPFCVIVSGVADRVTTWASPDGPDRAGASVWCTVQPAMAIPAARAVATVEKAFIGLSIPKVAEVDLHRPGYVDFVAGLVVPVERNPADRRDDVGVGLQLHERRPFLRDVAHDLEADRRRAGRRHRRSRRAVER